MEDAEFRSHLKKCVELCREDYDGEVSYRNLLKTVYGYFTRLYKADFNNPEFGELWDFLGTEKMWDYVKNLPPDYGIKMYSVGIEDLIDFNPGSSRRIIKESVGKMLLELPSTSEKISMSGRESKKPYFGRLDQCERGIIGSISFGNGEIIVIKGVNGDDEIEVSRHLGDLDLPIGPKVYEIGENSMAEEFIRDPKLSQIRPMSRVLGIPIYRRDKPAPEDSGRILGNITRRMHNEAGVVYANRFWDHVMVGKNIRIIDLENAHFGDDFERDIKRIESELSRRYSGSGVKKAMKAFNQEYN